MTEIKRLRVELEERSYWILIGDGLLSETGQHWSTLFPQNRHAVIIFDSQVKHIAKEVQQQLSSRHCRTNMLEVPNGEGSKSVERLNLIWLDMLRARTDRGSVVLAVGGGVVGDLAGFAAATFARGIPLVQIPTTLLSQVDSSVGGKTGINLPDAKNMVGVFWQPGLVIIDTQTLQTLPRREFISGLAEVVKYGVILLPELLEFLESNAVRILDRESHSLMEIIEQSCKAKAQVVHEDERESSGRRAILNYGHTFAHAIEAVSGYGRWLHGEAVAIGMNMAANLAHILGRVDVDFVQRQANLLKQLHLPIALPEADGEKLWQAMQHDKKVVDGTLRFILPDGGLRNVQLVPDISREQVLAAIDLGSESKAR